MVCTAALKCLSNRLDFGHVISADVPEAGWLNTLHVSSICLTAVSTCKKRQHGINLGSTNTVLYKLTLMWFLSGFFVVHRSVKARVCFSCIIAG